MTNEQALQWATERIDALAVKLNVTTGQVWEILKTQAYIDSVVGIINILLSATMLAMCVKCFVWADKKRNEEVWVLSLVIGLVFFFVFLINMFMLDNIVTGFLNPDYYALKQILRAVGK